MKSGVIARRLVFPLHERLMKRPTIPYLAELERAQYLPRHEVEQLQMSKLRDLLQIAVDHCPWHRARIRDADIDLGAELTIEDLRRLPTMEKADAIANGKDMVWHEVPGGAYQYNTGGSSGKPLIFYFGRRRQAADAASRIRGRRWFGVGQGEPEVYLWGSPMELNKTDRIKQVRDRLLNQLVLNAFEMSPGRMTEYCRAIQRYQPRCLYGYATSVSLLAAHARDREIELRLPKLKVVCTTGEPLYPHQRKLIGEVFGVPVANEFGARDSGLIAHESPAGQMLLQSETIILEVLDADGRPVAPGQTGEAVITGLESQAQPFIRYSTGDVVRYSDELCKDGRGLHVIAEVIGRTTDFLVRPDGTIMHALAGIYVLRAVPGVAEFKIIQPSVDRLLVQVVPGEQWNAEAPKAVIGGLQERMGAGVAIDLEIMDEIPAERSGKHRYVVSHVDLGSALSAALPRS